MTINEIARIAGVSRATVSRYLNNGYVSDEKREKLRVVIEETGYSPSVSAQTLRSGRTKCVGVVIPKINSDSIARMVAGISRRLSNAGYQLLLACTENDEKKELNFLNVFSEGNVDGIILFGTILTKSHKTVLNSLSVPSVVLAQDLAGFPCVFFDDYAAGFEMGKHLAKTGKIFGMICVTKLDEAVGTARRKGFLDALFENGKSVEFVEECGFSMEDGRTAGKKILTQHGEIDTLFCVTDTIASGALTAAREIGRAIPSPLQIAGIGDSTIGLAVFPPLTTVRFRYESAGMEAASMLLERIVDRTSPIKSVKLSQEIIIRGTTR